MSERALKIIIYLAGVFCLFAFIAVRSLPVLNTVLVEEMIPEHFEFTRYGELYYQSYIYHFKEELPTPIRKYRLSEKHPDANEADILMFGDSFLDISRQVTLPERLADTLSVKVFFHRFLAPMHSNPYCALNAHGYTSDGPKTVIYECVERNIPMKFDAPYMDTLCNPAGYGGESRKPLVRHIFPSNSEEMYNQFLKRSVFTTGLFALNAGLKFDLFGYITSNTPKYRTGDQPWLFLNKQLDDEPGSYYYQHSQEQIDRYCDNIALLQKDMKEKLNMDMIFLPLPNKYTLYHDLAGEEQEYNGFMPALQKGLEERGVNFVNVYDDYRNSDEFLYYGTDTHWNKKGVDLCLEKVLEKLNQQ